MHLRLLLHQHWEEDYFTGIPFLPNRKSQSPSQVIYIPIPIHSTQILREKAVVVLSWEDLSLHKLGKKWWKEVGVQLLQNFPHLRQNLWEICHDSTRFSELFIGFPCGTRDLLQRFGLCGWRLTTAHSEALMIFSLRLRHVPVFLLNPRSAQVCRRGRLYLTSLFLRLEIGCKGEVGSLFSSQKCVVSKHIRMLKRWSQVRVRHSWSTVLIQAQLKKRHFSYIYVYIYNKWRDFVSDSSEFVKITDSFKWGVTLGHVFF